MKTETSRHWQTVFGMTQTLVLLLFCGIPFLFAVRLVEAITLTQVRVAARRGYDPAASGSVLHRQETTRVKAT
jgi:hypothetical protein